MPNPLTETEIKEALEELEGWNWEDNHLKKSFTFKNFRKAISFILAVAFEAEEQIHHPEIFNVYNKVDISLNTHTAGGKVTEKDIKLATTIESLYK